MTSAGVIPTPAIAYVTPAMGFDAGIVISASHNPFEDNGIKVFSGKGEKFTETLEREVEAIVAGPTGRFQPEAVASFDHTNVVEEYIAHTLLALPDPRGLRGAKIAIDTANGATTTVAPQLFAELGFDVASAQRHTGRAEYQPRLRIDASRRPVTAVRERRMPAWASRSTATAIARSSRTRPAASSTAMPCC